MGLRHFFSNVVDLFRPKSLAYGGYDGTGRWITTGGTGINADQITEYSALSIATYYACIRNIAEDIAKLPFYLYRKEGAGATERRVILPPDPLTDIFNHKANPCMTAYTYRSTSQHWAAGWGNGFAKKLRNGRGQIVQLLPIHPSRVFIRYLSMNDIIPRFNYKIFNNDGSSFELSPDDMFHTYGMSSDGVMGYSVVQIMSNTLGIASEVQRFTRNFYGHCARPAGILETPGILNKQTRQNLRESWEAMYAGPHNAGKTAVLEAGVTYKGMTMPLKDAEFMELRQFQKKEIAGTFRMPLYKLQDIERAQGWSTLDAQETDYVTSCLLPWVLRLEQEVKMQLMDGYEDNVYPCFDFRGLLRGDLNARKGFYQTMRTMGLMTGNEIRVMEGLEPSADKQMDVIYIQGGMMPLDKAAAGPQAPAPFGGKPATEDKSDNPDDTNKDATDEPKGVNRIAVLKNGATHHA